MNKLQGEDIKGRPQFNVNPAACYWWRIQAFLETSGRDQ